MELSTDHVLCDHFVGFVVALALISSYYRSIYLLQNFGEGTGLTFERDKDFLRNLTQNCKRKVMILFYNLLSKPKPVIQLLVPLWKVLFSEAKQIGWMSSEKVTGADSFRRHMSFSYVELV